MADGSEADEFLLEQIRRGDPAGWSQFVDRYQGRLLAFARQRSRSSAEDLVQETFLNFLQSLHAFRADAGLETYLFAILRRRIIDAYRGQSHRACSIEDLSHGDDPIVAREASASWYARRDERDAQRRRRLAEALRTLLARLREADLRGLRVVEALFYAQRRNNEVAGLCGVAENHVALIKHRFLKDLRAHVTDMAPGGDLPLPGEDAGRADLLTDVWEEQRLTCPGRSTLGRFTLDALEPEWHAYVAFHVEQLGCRFCRANLDDLRQLHPEPNAVRHQIFQSTVGFLHSLPGGDGR